MKKIYKIKVENKTYEVEVEEVKEVAGNVVSSGVQAPVAAPVQAAAPVAAAPVAPSAGTTEVLAPMPGVLVDIRVNVGDNVTRGQVVAVLEAMKMETEILSDVDGKVTAVKASKGASINHDDLILTIN